MGVKVDVWVGIGFEVLVGDISVDVDVTVGCTAVARVTAVGVGSAWLQAVRIRINGIRYFFMTKSRCILDISHCTNTLLALSNTILPQP